MNRTLFYIQAEAAPVVRQTRDEMLEKIQQAETTRNWSAPGFLLKTSIESLRKSCSTSGHNNRVCWWPCPNERAGVAGRNRRNFGRSNQRRSPRRRPLNGTSSATSWLKNISFASAILSKDSSTKRESQHQIFIRGSKGKTFRVGDKWPVGPQMLVKGQHCPHSHAS